MLRIIAKFDYVEMAVVAFQQMRLRPAAHLADQACGLHQHRVQRIITLKVCLATLRIVTDHTRPYPTDQTKQTRMND